MYKHILVPTDGSKLSLKAARQAARLARRVKAKLTAVYVARPFTAPVVPEGAPMRVSLPELIEQHKAQAARLAEAALAGVRKAAAAEKVACATVAANEFEPWRGIIDTARRKRCDVIVMGSHGRGALMGALLGSETVKVLSHSKTPVLVCR